MTSTDTPQRGVDGPDLSAVVPLFNEVESLDELVERLSKSLQAMKRPFEILLVDDGSTDETASKIRDKEALHPEVRGVFLARNYGQSTAMQAGFDHSRGRIVVTLDGDLQNDPDDIARMVDLMEESGADLVCGWRIKRQDPLEKKLPSKLFNGVTSKISGLDIHDFNCGFKAYRKEVLDEVSFYGDMHRFMPYLAHKRGFNVTEVPIQHHPRKADSSKYRFERYPRGGLDLLTVIFLTTYIVRPMHLFGSIGFSTIFFGCALFLYLFFGRWIWGGSIGSSPLLSVSFLAIGIGVQVLMTGFLAELIVHWRKTPQHEFSIKKEED